MGSFRSAVAVISGGLDSVGYAYLWKLKGYAIFPITFIYGQKGLKEVGVAKRLSAALGFEKPLEIDVSFMKGLWKGSQLTDEHVNVESTYKPNVIVPLRNAVFLVIAMAYAIMIGADVVLYGATLSDCLLREDGKPMYPDCALQFIESLERALNLGYFWKTGKVGIWSPSRESMTKSQLLRRSFEAIGDIVFETWSCYLSGNKHCGRCESCANRKKAFEEAGITDKTEYESP